MARRKKGRSAERPPLTWSVVPWRIRLLILGAALGALWGVALWLIGSLANDDWSLRSLLLLMMMSAMIGGGVAAAFGVFGARRRGEKVVGKLPYRRRR